MYVYGYGLGISFPSFPATVSLPPQPQPAGALVTTAGNITGTAAPLPLVKAGTQLSLVKAPPAVSPTVAAAIFAAGAKPAPAIVPFAPAKSTPVPGTTSVVTENDFAVACKRDLNGTVVAPGVCQAPDGAKISVDGKTGQPVCMNATGMCSPANQAAAAAQVAAALTPSAPTNVVLLGAAALAALMLLR